MTIRRALSLAVLIALTSLAAWGQISVANQSPKNTNDQGFCTPASSSYLGCVLANNPYLLTLTVPNPTSTTLTWSLTGAPWLTATDCANGTPCTFTGTPTQPGIYTLALSVAYTDGSASPTRSFQLEVGTANTLTIVQPGALTNGAVGTPITPTTITATGGVPFITSGGATYQWSIVQGSQPDGLVIDPNTGVLSGTPTNAGTFQIIIGVLDAVGTAKIRVYSFTATGTNTLTITTTSLPPGLIGTAYSQNLQETGGPAPGVTWSILSGSFPPGLAITSNANSTGTISGTPTAAGTFNFTVQANYTVTTGSGSTQIVATQALSIVINSNTLTITTTSLPNGVTGTAYSQALQETGGPVPGVLWSVTVGTLPPGLNHLSNADSSGTISGTPTTAGQFSFTVQATYTSAAAVSATQALSITITSPTPALTLPNPAAVTGFVGQTQPTWMQFVATGGTPPYTYNVQNGSLPTGLSLNAQTGVISGQATQPGTFLFIVRVTDSVNAQASSPSQGASIAISLTSISGLTISPGGALTAGTQPTVTITLGTSPATQVTGTLTVSFTRLFDSAGSREILFSTGAPTASFTIPAGSTQATFPGGALTLITGTAAGFGTISATFQDSLGNNITPPAPQQQTSFSITGTAPVIRSFTMSCTGTTYTATVVGYSSTLTMTNGVFNFTPTSGTNLAASSVTVQLGPAFSSWYSSAQSNQFGGQFMLTVPFAFSVSGGASTNPIAAATVTLTNGQGTSAVSLPANPNACK